KTGDNKNALDLNKEIKNNKIKNLVKNKKFKEVNCLKMTNKIRIDDYKILKQIAENGDKELSESKEKNQ
ncbi:44843_t:CDS:1, partial [Gigaspora margarita]